MTFPPFVVFMIAAVRTPNKLGHEKNYENEKNEAPATEAKHKEEEENDGIYMRVQEAKRWRRNINKRSRRVAIGKSYASCEKRVKNKEQFRLP